MIGITVALYLIMIFVTPITLFFGFTVPPVHDLLISVGIGCAAAVWYEGVKWIKRLRTKN
jgi:Ca2+-transporting ATPase